MAANEGFKRHGIQAEILSPEAVEPCDLAVCWGVKRPTCLRSGRRALVLERGYVGDRFYWTSAGFDDLNGRADFCNATVPSDRWKLHFNEYLKPWRAKSNSDKVLLIGQVIGDASLRGVNIKQWYRTQVRKLKDLGYHVIFRNHPKELYRTVVSGVDEYDHGNLSETLDKVKFVVTYNSNVAVDAVLAGVPTVTMDRGSMAYDVTSHVLTPLPGRFDRIPWVWQLAYTQWSTQEITSGEMWDHLKVGMEREVA
jgi:hypothetical protein